MAADPCLSCAASRSTTDPSTVNATWAGWASSLFRGTCRPLESNRPQPGVRRCRGEPRKAHPTTGEYAHRLLAWGGTRRGTRSTLRQSLRRDKGRELGASGPKLAPATIELERRERSRRILVRDGGEPGPLPASLSTSRSSPGCAR